MDLLLCMRVSVQVTSQLAALCIQAHQQKAAMSVRYYTTYVLTLWLYKASKANDASPGSRLAVSMRQQLQRSELLQQMPAIFQHASDAYTAAAADLTTFGQAAPGSSAGSSSSSTDSVRVAEFFNNTQLLTSRLLSVHIRTSELSSSEANGFNLASALPAAPAAMQLHRLLFQTSSRLQQQAGREGSPAPVLLLVDAADFQSNCCAALGEAHWAVVRLLKAVHQYNVERQLQSLPGTRELLLCPELMPCLASTVLVSVLGMDSKEQHDTGSSRGTTRGAAAQASSSSRSSAGSSSSSRPASATRGSSQPQSDPASGTISGRHQAGSSSTSSCSSSSTSSGSSAGKLSNGISLQSLTPLSRGLFGLLGVEQDVLLKAARGAKELWHMRFEPARCELLFSTYNALLMQQVR
jgi:hypothetical protein